VPKRAIYDNPTVNQDDEHDWFVGLVVFTTQTRRTRERVPVCGEIDYILVAAETADHAMEKLARYALETAEFSSDGLTMNGEPAEMRFEGVLKLERLREYPGSGSLIDVCALALTESAGLSALCDLDKDVQVKRLGPQRAAARKHFFPPELQLQAALPAWYCIHAISTVPGEADAAALECIYLVCAEDAANAVTSLREASEQIPDFVGIRRCVSISNLLADEYTDPPEDLTELTYVEFEVADQDRLKTLLDGDDTALWYLK
jgi:hypothetical protein